MLQDSGAPDFTKLLPWWADYVLWVALLLAVGGVRLRKRLRTADEAEADKVKVAIASALAPVEKQLSHAEKLAALLERENTELQEHIKAKDEHVARLEARIAKYLDDEVEAQKKMARVIGQCAELEKRVVQLEADRG